MGTVKKTKKVPDALDLLAEQHDTVDALIEQLEDEQLSTDQKRGVFRELADNLAAHAAMEERLFYPEVKARQTEELVLESGFEHLQIKRILADMLKTDVEDEGFAAQLRVLKEEVTHHAHEEEEQKLFPMVREMMSSDELEALGGELLAVFEQLLASEPRMQVPEEMAKPAPL